VQSKAMRITEKNGRKISALTLGTAQLGLAYGVNNGRGMPSFEEASLILDTALSEGIISFDTAKAYGESEAVLGRYFAKEGRERTIITKALFTDVDASQVKDTLFAAARDSMRKLGTERLPFLELHNESMLEKYGDVIVRALHELKAEGLADGIGVSFSDKKRIVELTKGCGFDVIQMPANIFDNREIADGTVKRLSESGACIFIRSLYLQGLFFKDTDSLPDRIKSAKAPLDRLHRLAEDSGVGMAELAVTFIRDTEGIASLILGCETPEQLLEGASLINAPKISEEVRREAMRIAEDVEPVVIRPWEWYK